MTRLIDVAQAAGVSRSTVSNVFNAPDRVRPAIRARVEAAARALGYGGPDPAARALRAGKMNAIGVVPFGDFGVAMAVGNPLLRMFLLGVAEVCDEVGANLMIVSRLPGETGAGTANALVDGFILARPEDVTEIEAARLRRLPFVVLDFDAGPDVSSVSIDARGGCRTAAEHLIALGHRRFGIVSFLRGNGPPIVHRPAPDRGSELAGMPLDRKKLAGYGEALAAAGISLDDVPIVQAQPADRAAAALILDAAPEATAILAMADMQAIAVMEEARSRGRSVPSDLSVVGFNDIPEARLAQPQLTTVDSMGTARGRAAARLLFDGGPPQQIEMPAELKVRASTAPPRP